MGYEKAFRPHFSALSFDQKQQFVVRSSCDPRNVGKVHYLRFVEIRIADQPI